MFVLPLPSSSLQHTVEQMGREAGVAMQAPLQGLCRDVIAPSFEQACSQMLQQANNTFQRGTHECKSISFFVLFSMMLVVIEKSSRFNFPSHSDTQQLEAHLEQVRRRHDQSRDPILQQMTSLSETCRCLSLYYERYLIV